MTITVWPPCQNDGNNIEVVLEMTWLFLVLLRLLQLFQCTLMIGRPGFERVKNLPLGAFRRKFFAKVRTIFELTKYFVSFLSFFFAKQLAEGAARPLPWLYSLKSECKGRANFWIYQIFLCFKTWFLREKFDKELIFRRKRRVGLTFFNFEQV